MNRYTITHAGYLCEKKSFLGISGSAERNSLDDALEMVRHQLEAGVRTITVTNITEELEHALREFREKYEQEEK